MECRRMKSKMKRGLKTLAPSLWKYLFIFANKGVKQTPCPLTMPPICASSASATTHNSKIIRPSIQPTGSTTTKKMIRLVASRSNSIRSIASCVDSLAARTTTLSRQSSAFAVTTSSHYQIPTSFPSSHYRQFSSSHDDFSPQKKHNLDGNDNESEILKMIDSHVKENNIMLYMKGSPSQPMVSQLLPSIYSVYLPVLLNSN